MVQTESPQIASETSEWRQILKSYRREFHDFQQLLQQTCSQANATQVRQLARFDNQFQIQLINIHDLKQAIKAHEKRLQLQASSIANNVYTEHEQLFKRFITLENTLQELRADFNLFIAETSCA